MSRSEMTLKEREVTEIHSDVPLDVGACTKEDLVAVHEEMRRLHRVLQAVSRSAKILSSVRQAVELRLGLEDHKWDLETDYDPDDAEKLERPDSGDNPLARLFGGGG